MPRLREVAKCAGSAEKGGSTGQARKLWKVSNGVGVVERLELQTLVGSGDEPLLERRTFQGLLGSATPILIARLGKHREQLLFRWIFRRSNRRVVPHDPLLGHGSVSATPMVPSSGTGVGLVFLWRAEPSTPPAREFRLRRWYPLAVPGTFCGGLHPPRLPQDGQVVLPTRSRRIVKKAAISSRWML